MLRAVQALYGLDAVTVGERNLVTAARQCRSLGPGAEPASVGGATSEPISTLVGGGEIAARVEWLIDDSRAATAAGRGTLRARWMLLAAVAIAAFVLAYVPLLETIHAATEVLVQRLP